MHILPLILSLGAIAPSTAAVLKPWQVSSLNTFTPFFERGESPWSTINATISDPSTVLPPSTAICTFQWKSLDTTPYNIVNKCTNGDKSDKSLWTFEMLVAIESRYQSPMGDFVLRFTRKVEVDAAAGHDPHEVAVSVETFVGSERFFIGPKGVGNLGGACGGKQDCSFSLYEGVDVEQTRMG